MIDFDKIYDQKEALEMVKAQYPVLYKCMLKEKSKEGRSLPRSLRRCYASNNKSLIEAEVVKALSKGYTYAEITADFKKWKEGQEFIE